MKALEVKGLSKDFGGLQVLKQVSFSVEPGERRAIIGPNGAGKTTLFNIISGIVRPSSGEVLLFGQNITRMIPYRRSRLGLARTFQKNNLFFNLSLYENIRLALLTDNWHIKPRDFLKSWGLWRKRKIRVGDLSYGEQRQVEILLALAQTPKILLLDEPTAGMSAAETELITHMITNLPRDITVMIIEHDMEVLFNLADRVTVLHQGQILCEGEKDEVRSDHRVKEVYLGEPLRGAAD